MNISAVYIAKPEFLPELCEELGSAATVIEDLVLSPVNHKSVCFAQDIWLDPQIVKFESISQAVNILKQAGKFWYLHPVSHVRRSRLIENQLRKTPPLNQAFPLQNELPAIGGFTLLDNNTLLFSTTRLKPWPDGKCYFIEDKINPPNRAYLKLWEALTLLRKYPQRGETAIDLGSSPGGWTYVMQALGAHVTAVDKALLAPHIAQLPNVSFLQQSAFALEPEKMEKTYDWVLSDIACYPDRAYNLVMKWIKSGKARHLIFTIKLQGKTDLAVIQQFKDIPDSHLINMYFNKHEVTFFYPASKFKTANL